MQLKRGDTWRLFLYGCPYCGDAGKRASIFLDGVCGRPDGILVYLGLPASTRGMNAPGEMD